VDDGAPLFAFFKACSTIGFLNGVVVDTPYDNKLLYSFEWVGAVSIQLMFYVRGPLNPIEVVLRLTREASLHLSDAC
jgi:hypothetical protein